MKYHTYEFGAHELERLPDIEADSHEAAMDKLLATRPYSDKKYLRVVDPTDLELASDAGKQFIRFVEKALRQWKHWATFFRDGGVPGCRVLETTDLQRAARWLARDTFIRWGNLSEWYANDAVSELQGADSSYNPDY